MFRLNKVEFEINDIESIFYIHNKNENGLSFGLQVKYENFNKITYSRKRNSTTWEGYMKR